MKLIAVWAGNDPDTAILSDALAEAGHEIAYWVGLNEGKEHAPHGAIFHDHYDAWAGNPAETFRNTACPPSADLIERSYRTESFTLSMMDKRFDAAPVEERKQVYYTMLGYWNMVLDRVKPDAVIYSAVPHTVYTYVLYELVRERGIPTICFEDVWFVGRLIEYHDFWKGSDEIRAALEKRLAKGVTVDDFGPDFRKYWDRQAKKPMELPWYMREQKKIGEGLGVWKHRARILARTLRSGTFFEIASSFVMRRFRKDLRSEHREFEKPAEMKKPFVYFPLGFQPERTSSPQAWIYNEQILAIETLAAALPDGWEVYVKEHPSQWLMRTKTEYSSVRYPGYYRRIAAVPRVRLVPITTDSFSLTEHAMVVATTGGTVGWEALLRGKTPLVFGIPWYRDCPGVIRVSSIEECKQAYSDITKGKAPRSDEGTMLAYLKALEDTTRRAYLQVHLSDICPVISNDESMRVVAAAIIEWLAASKKVGKA